MLSRNLLEKYSPVLTILFLLRAVPFAWNSSTHKITRGSTSHLLQFLTVLSLNWSHLIFLAVSFVLQFHSTSSLQKELHLLWLIGTLLKAVGQLTFLLQAEDLISFFNLLVSDSKKVSEELQKKISSRKEVRRQERLLEFILFAFAGAASVGTLFSGIFFIDPLQPQFLFGCLPQSLQSQWVTFLCCGVFELTLALYMWTSFTFILFLEFSTFFKSRTELTCYRKELERIHGSWRWVLQYRKFQVFQYRFNESVGRVALPLMHIVVLCASLVGNYGFVGFFHWRHRSLLQLPLALLSPFIACVLSVFELTMYPWMASIHSLSSSSVSSPSRSLWRNPAGFPKNVCAAYSRSFIPLKVSLGPFKVVLKSTILKVLSFSLIATAKLAIFFPHSSSSSYSRTTEVSV